MLFFIHDNDGHNFKIEDVNILCAPAKCLLKWSVSQTTAIKPHIMAV